MNITTKPLIEEVTLPITTYVERKLLYTFSDGTVENTQEQVANVISAFGRLLNTLANQNILSAPEIEEIVEGSTNGDSTLEAS